MHKHKLEPERDDLMIIKEVNSFSDVNLKVIWDSVIERCEHSIFSTWDWISTWWKYFGEGKQPIILLSEEEGQVIGIAPLMYSVTSAFGIPYGQIELIGTPISDYTDFIIIDKNEECMRLFLEYLKAHSEKWSYLKLSNIKGDSKNIDALSKLSDKIRPACKCSYFALPNSYDEFLKSLGQSMRRNLRKGSKELSDNFSVEFVDCSSNDLAKFGIDCVFELHQKRWRARGFPGAFADQVTQSFHREIANKFAEKGWLGLYVLKLSGNPVAAAYGFLDKKKYYFYLQGSDLYPRYIKYAVGNQITAYAVSKSIEKGLEEFDFMRGDDAYKDRWHTIPRWNIQLIFPKNKIFSAQYQLFHMMSDFSDKLKSRGLAEKPEI